MIKNKKEKTINEEDIDIIKDELLKFSKLEAVYFSQGGQILFESLMADAVSCINTLSNKYSTLTQQEFISLCADMNSKIALAKILKKSEKNKKEAEEDLKKALLKETLLDEQY